jgi:hypothetical protein
MAAIAALLAAAACSYLPGDPVPLMRRNQYGGKRTAWHEVPHRIARFLTDTTSSMEGIPTDAPSDEPFKISLALHGVQHTTPWITIADGNGHFLSHLQLLLTASGDSLTGVRWETQYAALEPPAHITVTTVWDEALEHDLALALGVLFLIGACILIVTIYITCCRHGGFALARLLADADAEHDERDAPSALHGGGYAHGRAPRARSGTAGSYRYDGARKMRVD